jgi:hypothetical protein
LQVLAKSNPLRSQTDPSSLSLRAFIRIQKPSILPPVAPRPKQLLSFVIEVTITLFPSARSYSAVSCQSPGLLPRHFDLLIAPSSTT